MGFAATLNARLRRAARHWLGPTAWNTPEPVAVVEEKRKPLYSAAALADLAQLLAAKVAVPATWRKPEAPHWLTETVKAMGRRDGKALAMDSVPYDQIADYAANSSPWSEGLGFMGYAYLSELQQRPEYRRISEIWAAECTRKWIKLRGDDAKRLAALEAHMRKHNVRERVREAVEHDGAFGRGQIFMDFGDEDAALKLPLSYLPETITVGSLKGLKCVEPYWSYPLHFNTNNPLAQDFYRPSSWQVMQREVHYTRMLTVVGRELPDILKPVYMFGGVSLSQMAKPYIDGFIRNRTSIGNLLHSFSTMVLATNMSVMLSPGGAKELVDRMQIFIHGRENGGLQVVDKDSEELTNVSAPINGTDKLLDQSRGFISSTVGIPHTVLFGDGPDGMNASAEGELSAFRSHVKGYNEKALGSLIHTLLVVLQLDMDGTVDPGLTFDFVELDEPTEAERATIRKTNMEIATGYINAGVLDPADERERLKTEEGGLYFGMELQEPPEPEPIDESDFGEEDGDEPPQPAKAEDAWNEGDHPRAENGRFGSGGVKLTSREKAELARYSGDDFLRVNQSLREGHDPGEIVAHIDRAIAKSVVPNGVTLYRGMTREAAKKLFGSHVRVGDEVSDPAFLSTTQSRGIAGMRGLGGVVLRIEPEPGARGLSLAEVSDNPAEKEVLLPRGAKLTIKGLTAPKSPGDPLLVRVAYGGPRAERAADAWNEEDHPRAENGRFGSGASTAKEAKTTFTSLAGVEHIENLLPRVASAKMGEVRRQQEGFEEAVNSGKAEQFTKEEHVDPREVHSIQQLTDREKILSFMKEAPSAGGKPLLLRSSRGLVLIDGNHRANAALLKGEGFDAEVFDYDAWEKAKEAVSKPTWSDEDDALLAELLS